MINYTTAIVNNKFEVTFDFSPKDVTYSRNNYTATHRGNGTSHRQGIWEGIECTVAQIKIGDGAWVNYNLPPNKKVVVTVSGNNIPIQAHGKYKLRTMGYHWLDTSGTYPFFWYGNIGGVEYRYNGGSFRDSWASTPSNLHTVHACVPPDWRHVNTTWSDWAYLHGKNTNNWHKDNGRYEQRNANYESARNNNGWISDSNRAQMWRKSIMMFFEKDYYTNTIYSNGVAVNPDRPILDVYYAKGDSGQVKLTYKDPSGSPGHVKLAVYCNGKTAIQDDFHVSGEFPNGGSYTYTIDFNRHFGEAYRANDVYYEAWSKNSYGYISPSTGRKGVHRYNGRPSVPTGLKVEGDNGLIYNAVNFIWNKSSDPDGDYIVYDLWVQAYHPDRGVIRNDFIVRGHDGLRYRYDISNLPDGTELDVKVRASDNLITSDWCRTVHFTKGSKPNTTVALIAPIKADTDIYFNNPRFGFSGWDGKADCVVILNNKQYDSINNPELFTKGNNRFIFRPAEPLKDGLVSLQAYLKNAYGEGNRTQVYKFTKKTALEKVNEGDIIKVMPISEVQDTIINMGKAFNNKTNIVNVTKQDYYKASFYNDCFKVIKDINDYINNLISNNTFDYTLKSREVIPGEVNDDLVWEHLIDDITSM